MRTRCQAEARRLWQLARSAPKTALQRAQQAQRKSKIKCTAKCLTRCVAKMCCKNVLHFGRNRFEFHFAKALVDGCCVSKGIGGICIESDQHPTSRRTLLDHRVMSHSYSWRFDAEPGVSDVSVAAGSKGWTNDVNLDFNCSEFLVDLIALWCLVLFESGKWLDIDYRRRSLCVMCDLTILDGTKG